MEATMAMNLHLLHHSQPSFTTKHAYSIPRSPHYFNKPSIFSPKTPLLKHQSNSSSSFVTEVASLSFASNALLQDVGATAFVLGGGYALVSVFDYLTSRNVIPQNLSRKLVHIISGLLFVSSWPLFSSSTAARYFASLPPLANGLRLVVHGLSLAKDEGLIKSVTREGKPEELLRGPLYYVLILAFCALAFWRESPVGLLSLAMMSGGDGIADIMGRKFGSVKIPYNQEKSWVGSISMFVFGFLVSLGMLYYFSALGYLQLDWSSTTMRVAAVSFVATVVESLPIAMLIDDNISVPLVTMVTVYICFCLQLWSEF